MKPTLKDIAASTGLSVSTVSRVLRGKAIRDSENVDLILKAAQELNYPFYNAKIIDAVKEKQTTYVALIVDAEIGEFYASFFAGFSEAALLKSMQISLYNVPGGNDKLTALIRELHQKSFDAAILFMPKLQQEDYQEIVAHSPRPFILVSAATVYNTVLDTVSFDSYQGGHLVGQHFHQRGYKELGVVIGNAQRNESLLRKSGFTDYIEHHSDMELIWQFEGDYSFESGQRAFMAYQKLEKKPAAIFLINDYMCFGFMEQAKRAGTRIPDDVALCGYDDLPICDHLYPSLSSVSTSYLQLGKTAVELISEKIRLSQSEHKGQVRIVPVSLKVRESS